MLRYSLVPVRVPYPNCGYDTGTHMTWRIGQEVGDHVSPQTRVDRSIRLATLGNRRITARNLQMRYLGRHGRRVSIQIHQEPATCFPVEIPESCPEASTNSWSSLITSLACELCLTISTRLRDFGKFLLDPTSLLWAVYFGVIKILWHNKWHIKGNWYTYEMV